MTGVGIPVLARVLSSRCKKTRSCGDWHAECTIQGRVRTTMFAAKLRLARGASDELEPDGYLALTARLATMYGGTSKAPFFLRPRKERGNSRRTRRAEIRISKCWIRNNLENRNPKNPAAHTGTGHSDLDI
jgi:hypothetical protein